MERQKGNGSQSRLQRHHGKVVCGVVLLFIMLPVVMVGEYFIVHHIDEDNDSGSSTTVDLYSLPDSLIMGAATAARQVEGAWNESGKGESIWDHYAHTHPEWVEDGSTGDEACDSYHLYKRDVQMLVETGFKAYRFSISWPRILPRGTKDFRNEAGIQYYHDLIDEVLAHNLIPFVTIYHWDLPQVLQEKYNGWLNSSIADLYADYAGLVFQEYGNKIKYWITFNEPNWMAFGYINNAKAPGNNGTKGVDDYIATHNILRAHGKAYQLYNTTYRPTQNGSIGMAYFAEGVFPNNASDSADRDAALRYWEFSMGHYANPIYSVEGNYPTIVRERIDNVSLAEGRNESRLPHFTDEELEQIRGSYDFIGVNHYYSLYVTANYSSGEDSGVSNVTLNSEGKGLRNVLNWIRTMYGGVPVYISENGCASSLGLQDTDRITLYHDMIKALLEAIHLDGCNVIGYTIWTLMDNWNWNTGYTLKEGIWQTDFASVNKTRVMKQSAHWFQKLLSTRRLPNVTDWNT